MKHTALFATGLLAIVIIGVYGCSSSTTSTPAPTLNSTAEQATDEHSQHKDHVEHHQSEDGAAGRSDMEKMNAELTKLSEKDRSSAEKQHFCPVTNKMLGSMGAPIKLTVKEQDVWICCGGCKQTILDNPDEYLGKLNKE